LTSLDQRAAVVFWLWPADARWFKFGRRPAWAARWNVDPNNPVYSRRKARRRGASVAARRGSFPQVLLIRPVSFKYYLLVAGRKQQY